MRETFPGESPENHSNGTRSKQEHVSIVTENNETEMKFEGILNPQPHMFHNKTARKHAKLFAIAKAFINQNISMWK